MRRIDSYFLDKSVKRGVLTRFLLTNKEMYYQITVKFFKKVQNQNEFYIFCRKGKLLTL